MKIKKTLTVFLLTVAMVLMPVIAAAESSPRQVVAMISPQAVFVEGELDKPGAADGERNSAASGEIPGIGRPGENAEEDDAGPAEPGSKGETAREETADEAEPGAADRQAAPKKIGIVTLNSGNLNVRKGPSLEEEIIGKLPNGSVVDVLEPMEEWVKIPYKETIAYVSRPYLVIKELNVAEGNVVVLDPGHGGRDPGAIAKDGTYESELVWEYTMKAKEALEKAGYTVVLTRGETTSCTEYRNQHDELNCRVTLAGKVNGDIYISIHADSNPNPNFRGTATFYNARNDFDNNQNPFPAESRRLAQLVHESVQPAIGSVDRGIANKNYYVNRMNTVPSVLIELACMSNASDLKLLKAEQTKAKFAEALTKAVNQYFGKSS